MSDGSPMAWLGRIPRSVGIVALVAAAILTALLCWMNYGVLNEAFGGGPPYYGRTTNMDKWSNPVPRLLAIDLAGLAIVAALAYLGLSRLRR